VNHTYDFLLIFKKIYVKWDNYAAIG